MEKRVEAIMEQLRVWDQEHGVPRVTALVVALAEEEGIENVCEIAEPWVRRISEDWTVCVNTEGEAAYIQPENGMSLACIPSSGIGIWFRKRYTGAAGICGGYLMSRDAAGNLVMEGEGGAGGVVRSTEAALIGDLEWAVAGARRKDAMSLTHYPGCESYLLPEVRERRAGANPPRPTPAMAVSKGGEDGEAGIDAGEDPGGAGRDAVESPARKLSRWRVRGVRIPVVEEMEIIIEATSMREAEDLILLEDGPYEAEIQRIIQDHPAMDWAPFDIRLLAEDRPAETSGA